MKEKYKHAALSVIFYTLVVLLAITCGMCGYLYYLIFKFIL